MAVPGAEQQAPEAPAAEPGGGAVGGQSAQLVQQISMLLAQLAQEEPDPAIQQLVRPMMQQAQHLETVVGKDDEEDMASGLHNPGGGGEGGGAEPGEGAHGKPAVTIAIHAGEPKPKDFGGAQKAARAAMKSGSLPTETERTMNKKKG